MAIGHVVTRGYGNGTLTGNVNLVVVRGFTAGEAVEVVTQDSAGGGPKRVIWSPEAWLARFEKAEAKAVRAPRLPRAPKQPDLLPEHIQRLTEVRRTLESQRTQTQMASKVITRINRQIADFEAKLADDAAVLLLLLTME